MTVKIFHTPAGIIIGLHDENRSKMIGSRVCECVTRPVLIALGEKAVSMQPLFTITKDEEYFVPRDQLVFGRAMEANSVLEASYLRSYAKPPGEDAGIELTTSPKQ